VKRRVPAGPAVTSWRQRGRMAFTIGILIAVAVAVFALGDWPQLRARFAGTAAKVSTTVHRLAAQKLPGTVENKPRKILLYECRRDGTRVLSGTPCGPGATVHEVDLDKQNSFTPPPLPPAPPPAAAPVGADGRHPGLLGPVRDNAQHFEEATRQHPVAPDPE
jgi:hypothetical protein